MTDTILRDWLLSLFWLECSIFGLGSFVGVFGVRLGEVWKANRDKMQTLAMQIALASALLGGVIATTASIWYLSLPCGEDKCRAVMASIPSGFKSELQGFSALDLTIYVDPLAALFVLLVGFFTVCVAIYSFGWLAEDPLRDNVAGGFNLFAGFMLLAIVVNNAFWLLLALESVSLASAYLMLYQGKRGRSREEKEKNRIAVQTYLIISHISTIFLCISILITGIGYNSLDLQQFRQLSTLYKPTDLSFLFFLCALMGLGIRAGMFPFQFWVPIAHPQLPTNTHAMMSAVMLKISIYLMIRFFFEFLRPISWWWGAVLLLLAGVTALLNVFYALLSRDLKRALAYHSVENIGIILAGLGLTLLFSSSEFASNLTVRSVAGLALVASLLHTFNHAIFKTLLFLGTGSIENRTGTFVMDELGGLLRRYPWTSIAFLAGAIAIAGFPPFNGFISEWLTVQSFFAGIDIFRYNNVVVAALLMIVLLATLILLGLAFGMTALAFVKIAGETLLGLPRNLDVDARAKQGDVPWSMRSVLLILAALCLTLGLMPHLLIPWLARATSGIGYSAIALQSDFSGLFILVGVSQPVYTATLSALPLFALVVLPSLTVLLAEVWRRWRVPQKSPLWIGGEKYQPQTMQFTGSALSSLVWEVTPWFSLKRLPEDPLPSNFELSDKRYFTDDINHLLNMLTRIILQISMRFGNWFQSGDIRRYLLYILATFIILLLVFLVLR